MEVKDRLDGGKHGAVVDADGVVQISNEESGLEKAEALDTIQEGITEPFRAR